MLGHDGPPSAFWDKNLITDKPLQRCPVRTLQLAREKPAGAVHEVDRYTGTYYPTFEAGHLLVKGGIADQPARYLELLEMIREMDAQVQLKAAPTKEGE